MSTYPKTPNNHIPLIYNNIASYTAIYMTDIWAIR